MSATAKQVDAPLIERAPVELLGELPSIAQGWTWGEVWPDGVREMAPRAPSRLGECSDLGLYASVQWSAISKAWCVWVTDERDGGRRGQGWSGNLRTAWRSALDLAQSSEQVAA